MSKRAVFMVTVAGTNITTTLMPVPISLTVSDKVGTHSDTASLEIDDTEGRIVLPQIGAPVIVALGWEGEGFDKNAKKVTRQWLRSKGNSIEGGTSEINLNVIAKRVLGLKEHQ